MKRHLAERNDGFVNAQNPILADRYEYKLNLLKNNIDLAQEGKLTYELSDVAEAEESLRRSLFDQLSSSQVETGERKSASKTTNFVLDTSVLVRPS